MTATLCRRAGWCQAITALWGENSQALFLQLIGDK
jgi:hypothetical protein